MTKVIEVIVENGVLKPLKEIKLKEGEILKIEIKSKKQISKQFYSDLADLKKRAKKVDNAHKLLEEIRNARY